MGFGKLLKEKMELKNVKQSELSAALGIPKTTLSSMINRDNMKVNIEVLLKICNYLECDPEDFYRDYLEEEQKKESITREPMFTDSEKKMITQYRCLDAYGKQVIDSILKIESARCQSQKQV